MSQALRQLGKILSTRAGDPHVGYAWTDDSEQRKVLLQGAPSGWGTFRPSTGFKGSLGLDLSIDGMLNRSLLACVCITEILKERWESKSMASTEKLGTHQKAIGINLDRTSYGSFAEIGAGQEVARWFLVVGGASGTVAKSISAYDKEVSDDLYGFGARYVSKERLEAMLDNEWTQIINQLSKSRGSETRFFSFVDTISARNYAGTNEPHGWVGLRFQLQPGGPPNDIVLHINMRDPSNPLQQEAIGILGVNLIYAVFYQLQTKEYFFENVAQDVEKRIEIDYVDLRGPAFEGWDQRAVLAYLVRAGLAEAVCFSSGGSPEPPTDVLHKKSVVLAPGTFEHVDLTHAGIHEQLLASAIQQLGGELEEKDPVPTGFFCLSAMPLREGDPPPEIANLLERIEALRARGGTVLLFRDRELYSMTATREPLHQRACSLRLGSISVGSHMGGSQQ